MKPRVRLVYSEGCNTYCVVSKLPWYRCSYQFPTAEEAWRSVCRVFHTMDWR